MPDIENEQRTDAAADDELDELTDIMFLAAGAGICFVVALFCVMTPFFLASDILSSLLLLGFFVATFGTVFFAYKGYKAEHHVQERHMEALKELAALKAARSSSA